VVDHLLGIVVELDPERVRDRAALRDQLGDEAAARLTVSYGLALED
jgi:regulator of sirC expression with transglutaminase-like and TPR domain